MSFGGDGDGGWEVGAVLCYLETLKKSTGSCLSSAFTPDGGTNIQ